MNKSQLQKFTHPKPRKITNRDKVLAHVYFHTQYPFHELKILDEPWKIRQILDAMMRVIFPRRYWKELTKDRKEQHLMKWHAIMFPNWVTTLKLSKIKPPPEREVMALLKKNTILFHKHIPLDKPLRIHVFPRIAIDAPAVKGDTVAQRTLLSIDGRIPWKRALRNSFAHEYMHLAYPYSPANTWSHALVHEGLAMHFGEDVVRTKQPQEVFITKQAAKKKRKQHSYWLNRKLSDNAFRSIYENSDNTHQLGYFLVGEFLKTVPDLSWLEIVLMEPKKIIAAAMESLSER
ncbi:MAG TPA: hypothetical protein QF873_00120 [Patescibacteria group bacterium]|nr:hypothetical protein [Patescibacteria group bacterium]